MTADTPDAVEEVAAIIRDYSHKKYGDEQSRNAARAILGASAMQAAMAGREVVAYRCKGPANPDDISDILVWNRETADHYAKCGWAVTPLCAVAPAGTQDDIEARRVRRIEQGPIYCSIDPAAGAQEGAEPRGCPTPGACSCPPTAPTPAGAGDLVEWAAYGIIDPDYARVFTIARCIAWAEGYAVLMHGSFTRDLDLLAVPWTDRASEPEHLVRRVAAAIDEVGVLVKSPGAASQAAQKPHGRMTWTLTFKAFGDPRFIDLSVMPRATAAEAERDALRTEMEGLRVMVERFYQANAEGKLCDCIDNAGAHYPSQHLADTLDMAAAALSLAKGG